MKKAGILIAIAHLAAGWTMIYCQYKTNCDLKKNCEFLFSMTKDILQQSNENYDDIQAIIDCLQKNGLVKKKGE